MLKKARNLAIGDVFRLHVYGQVLEAANVADGKLVKIKIELENQGRRGPSGRVGPPTILVGTGTYLDGMQTVSRQLREYSSGDYLEFTDIGYALEFICRSARTFHVYDYDDDWAANVQAAATR